LLNYQAYRTIAFKSQDTLSRKNNSIASA